MLTRREMLARMAAVSMVLVLEGCDAIADLPTGVPYHVAPASIGTTYYVDAAGDDENEGTSPGDAWATIARVNVATLQPGDRVLFAGGQIFVGALLIAGATKSGTVENPVRFGSFGAGRATIRRMGERHGIEVINADHIWIEDLDLDGGGRTQNSHCAVWARTGVEDHAGLVLRNLRVFGWGNNGIIIGGYGSAPYSYRDILIEGVEVFECRGSAGLVVWGNSRYDSCRNVTIRDCRVTDIIGLGWSWSGSGIAVFNTSDFLIEYCEVSHTGLGSGTSGGGPVGLWVSGVRDGVIRYCESHNNTAAGGLDGGGFDIDAGSQNVTLEYCYSHDNDGPALLMAQWSGTNVWFGPNRDNVVRYCVSENDARRNHSVISLWRDSGAGAGGLTGGEIYGNTFVVTSQGSGRPLVWIERSVSATSLRNNIFVTAGTRRFVRTQTAAPGVSFRGNSYHAPTGAWQADWNGTIHDSLAAWRDATGQETMNGASTGSDVNPLLTNPGGGGVVGNPRGLAAALTAYRLLPGSPMPAAGVDLRAAGLGLPAEDFFGSRIPTDGAYRAVGADSAGAGEPDPPPGNPQMHTLSDRFSGSALDAEKWSTAGNLRGSVVQADRLELRLGTGGLAWSACTSRGVFDLTGSHAVVQPGQMATGASVYTALMLRCEGDDENMVVLAYDSMTRLLSAVKRVNGVSTFLWSAAYAPATHRYWRIRESGGVVYWETSADGATWTTCYSESAPIAVSAIELRLYSDRRGQSSSPQVASFQSVNPA